MKRLYLLAAAVSVTGGMAFSAPQEDAPEKEAAVLDVQTPPSGKQDQPAIPERLLDDSHMNEELGINEFTAPSIRKIFEDLEGLPEIPEKVALRARPERPPMDRCSLALQLGGMMADGFVIVQCGKMNEVKPIALDLSSYAKAIGAGERVNRHAASLLKNAEDGDLSSFKNNLALIQSDVEQELASLGEELAASQTRKEETEAQLQALCAGLKAADEAAARKAIAAAEQELRGLADARKKAEERYAARREELSGLDAAVDQLTKLAESGVSPDRCSLRNEETCNVEQASWLHGLRVTMAVPANYKTIAMNCARVLWVLPSPKCADIFMIPMNVCFPLRFYLGVHLKKSFF